jgi:hypothetical protein
LRAIDRFKLRGTRSDRGRRAESSVGPAPVHLVGREADSVTWSGPRESGGSATRVTWAGAPRRPRRATRRKRTGEWARTRQQPPSPIIDILAAGSLIRSRPPSFTLRCVPLPTQLFFFRCSVFFLRELSRFTSRRNEIWFTSLRIGFLPSFCKRESCLVRHNARASPAAHVMCVQVQQVYHYSLLGGVSR